MFKRPHAGSIGAAIEHFFNNKTAQMTKHYAANSYKSQPIDFRDKITCGGDSTEIKFHVNTAMLIFILEKR